MKPIYMKIKQKGSVLVEFAILLPIFILLILGGLEAGWALYIQNTLNDAARQGARIAVTQNVGVNSIADSIDTIIQNANISTESVSITINPSAVSLQARGTPISVTVSMPYNTASILPTSMFMGNVTLQSQVTMSKEY